MTRRGRKLDRRTRGETARCGPPSGQARGTRREVLPMADRILVTDKDGKEVWIPADAARAWQKGQSMSEAELEQRKNELLAKLRAKTPALRK